MSKEARRTRWARRGVAGLALAAIVVPAGAAAALWLQGTGTPPAGTVTRGRDALWLGHAWVDGRRSQTDAERLSATLRGTGVRDLYVHVGPLDDRGRLDPALRPRAAWAVRALHTALPGARVLAWVGGVVGRGRLDLDRPEVVQAVATTAGPVLADGFDGVQYDLEPVVSGGPGLLAVLDAARPAIAAHGGILSVAASQVEPMPGLAGLTAAAGAGVALWSHAYLAAVARRVDQVVVMAYDTGLPTEPLYRGYVARQTRLALRAVAPPTDLLLGVPAFHDENPGHHAGAETVRAAVRGVRMGLADDIHRVRFGVAMYVDFAATASDWEAYRAGWGLATASG